MAPELVPAAPSWVYVTFLADSRYVNGVVALAKGLRKQGSAYPLVVAVLPDVPVEDRLILEEQGCVVRDIKPVYPPEKQDHFSILYYVRSYSMLRIWEFVEYSKIIFLNADSQVFDNIDGLFHGDDGNFYAVMDCLCDQTCYSLQYDNRQQCPNKVQWREDEMGPPPSPYFNVGMFMFKPNLSTYNDLLYTLEHKPPTPMGQKDFLNDYFRPIYKPLPLVYGLSPTMLQHHREIVELEKVKVVHYCTAGPKPWEITGRGDRDFMQRGDMKMLVNELLYFMNKEDTKVLVKELWDSMLKENLERLVKKSWDWLFEGKMMDFVDMKMLVEKFCHFMEDMEMYSELKESLKKLVKILWDCMIEDDKNLLIKKWRDIYEDGSLDYKNCAHVADEDEDENEDETVNMEPFIAALSEPSEAPLAPAA